MAFTWFDKFTDSLEKIPDKKDQDALILAIVRYGSTGEEPNLPYPLDAMFAGFREDIDHSLKSRENGSKGGKKTPSNPPSKAAKKGGSKGGKKTPSKDPLEDGGSSQYKTIQSNTVQDNTEQLRESDFGFQCLNALNETLATTYSGMPEECWLVLERSKDKWSVDEVKAMVEFKRDSWQNTRFRHNLTPNCLFSSNHFEQYMHQSKQEAVKSYAEYD